LRAKLPTRAPESGPRRPRPHHVARSKYVTHRQSVAIGCWVTHRRVTIHHAPGDLYVTNVAKIWVLLQSVTSTTDPPPTPHPLMPAARPPAPAPVLPAAAMRPAHAPAGKPDLPRTVPTA